MPKRHFLADASSELKKAIRQGVGFYSAGTDKQSRRVVRLSQSAQQLPSNLVAPQMEQLFKRGDLPVLCTTTSLAVGINMPAHLVRLCRLAHESVI